MVVEMVYDLVAKSVELMAVELVVERVETMVEWKAQMLVD